MAESISRPATPASHNWAGPSSVHLVSNTRWFAGRRWNGRPIVATDLEGMGLWQALFSVLRARDLDALVLNGATRTLLICCLWRWLVGPGRWRLISVDLILSSPRTRLERLKAAIMQRLLRRVDVFIFYFRDTGAVEKAYGIDPLRIRYVPFKVNDYDRVRSTPTTDEGYVLACGRSNRDYETLLRASVGLSARVVILCRIDDDLKHYGTELQSGGLPENVTLIGDDGSSASWISWISRARCVVVPVLPGVLSPAGISTYLVAMALGKCVIVTEGLATRGMLDDRTAVVVPASDPAALRDAIQRVVNDCELRERVAHAGQQYALALKDVNRLAQDVVECIGPSIEQRWAEMNLGRK